MLLAQEEALLADQEEVLAEVEALAEGLHPVLAHVYPVPAHVPVPVVAELGAARRFIIPVPFVQEKRDHRSNRLLNIIPKENDNYEKRIITFFNSNILYIMYICGCFF